MTRFLSYTEGGDCVQKTCVLRSIQAKLLLRSKLKACGRMNPWSEQNYVAKETRMEGIINFVNKRLGYSYELPSKFKDISRIRYYLKYF